MKQAPRIGGVGAVLVDEVFKVDVLPRGPGFPEPGTKLSASREQIDRVERLSRNQAGTIEGYRVGGPVLIALTYAHAFGAETRFAGAVGEDVSNVLIRRYLAKNVHWHEDPELAEKYLQTTDGLSGRSLLWIEKNTGARSILFSDKSLAPLNPANVPPDFPLDLDLLHIDGREHISAHVFASLVRNSGRPVYYDVGNWKRHSDLLLGVATHAQFPLRSAAVYSGVSPGSLDIHVDAGPLAEHIRNTYGLTAVIITDGENGLVFSEAGSPPQYMPSREVVAVDTNGAGDVFAGAVGWGISQEYSLSDAVRFANDVAGAKCEHDGHEQSLLDAHTNLLRFFPRSPGAPEMDSL